MEIVFNGKTYTKFQRLWNDIHFNRGFDDDHKFCYSAGLIYCRDPLFSACHSDCRERAEGHFCPPAHRRCARRALPCTRAGPRP